MPSPAGYNYRNMSTSPKQGRRQLFEPLKLHLPDDTGLENIAVFADLEARLARFAEAGDTDNQRSQQRKQAILQAVQNGDTVHAFLQTPSDLRLCLSLWRDNSEFFRRAPFDDDVLKSLQQNLKQPSRLQLWQLIQLYLETYQHLPCRRGLARFLQQHLQSLPERTTPSQEMRSYRQHAADLFARDGVQSLLATAQQSPQGMVDLCRAWHIPEQSNFAQQARAEYYLKPLENLPLGENAAVLEEIQQEEVKSTSMSDGLLLGHHAARLLMDKVLKAKADLPENWRHQILAILDDPRVPRSSPSFQMWWGRLEGKYVNAMRTWLSKLDLRLFLNILEEVARRHDRKDMLRMYPARRRFLEGLQAQGLLKESRLLLGKQAEHYVREQFDARDLSGFGKLSSADVSLIYLNLHGVHLLEGTHSFQVRIYQDLPIEGLADYEVNKFSMSNIRKYAADVSVKHSHSPVPRWQRSLIESLRQAPFNLHIDPTKVLSRKDYFIYVEHFSD